MQVLGSGAQMESVPSGISLQTAFLGALGISLCSEPRHQHPQGLLSLSWWGGNLWCPSAFFEGKQISIYAFQGLLEKIFMLLSLITHPFVITDQLLGETSKLCLLSDACYER